MAGAHARKNCDQRERHKILSPPTSMTLRIMNSYGPLNITFQTFFTAQRARTFISAAGTLIEPRTNFTFNCY
jgi:hypothetical protein